MSANDDLPWTTSRCNRLLRPLSSKLAKLRKELEAPRTIDRDTRNASTIFATKRSPRKTTNFTVPTRHPRGFEKLKDPDWMPKAKTGAARKKTYGGRGGKKEAATRSGSNSTYRPGEIAFTPLVARAVGAYQESPQLNNSPLLKYAKNRGPLLAGDERLQSLKKQMPSDIEKLVKGLCEAYANLLQATTTGEEKRWKGTRSLMGACLRKIPAYIELEEHFAELDKAEDEEEDRDISNEIYLHLEIQYEVRAGQGWRPFKQVVRAHGTSLICEAVKDGVLGLETVHLLVSHCSNVSAWDEAEKFLEAYLPLVDPLPVPIGLKANMFDQQRSIYMSTVRSFVDRTGRHRFLYDILDYMVSQELLPLEWLATESMRPIWDRLVRTVSEGDQCTLDTAFQFLETTLSSGMGLPDERFLEDDKTILSPRQLKPSTRRELRQALDTTFSSLFTVLCSIALVNQGRDEAAGEAIVHRVNWALNSVVVGLLRKTDIQEIMESMDADAEDVQAFAQRAVWAVFAPFLIRIAGCSTDATMRSLQVPVLVASIQWVSAQFAPNKADLSNILSSLPLVVSSVSRGTGRIWKDDGFNQLQHLVQELLSLSGHRLPHELWTLKRLALESAMEFSHATNVPQHMFFAKEIEKNMRMEGRLVIMQSPQKNDTPSGNGGFRWEEGIGEWVACTPFAKPNVKRLPQKPVRSLSLLPSPVSSANEEEVMAASASESEGEWPQKKARGGLSEDTILWDQDEDQVPHSSPVKKVSRISTSSLGKRSRDTSPKVIIPAKRARLIPAEPTSIAHSTLLKEQSSGPQRSRRTRAEIRNLVSKLRSQRSRTSLNNGQHDLQGEGCDRNSRSEVEPESNESSSDSDNNTEASWLSASSRSSCPRMRRSVSARTESPATDQDDDDFFEDELSKASIVVNRKLSRPSLPRIIQRQKSKWGLRKRIADEEGSEDELSFH